MTTSITEGKSKNEVDNLKQSLNEMPSDMRIFSLAMRSLYSNNAVGTSSDAARKFRKLRDDTRDDAMVFLKCILPISTKYVASIQEYFQYYEALTIEQWNEALKDILEETTIYKEIAQVLIGMYEDLMVPLKKREDEAKLIVTEFKHLQQEYERQRAALEGAAKSKRSWAFWLSFVPYVNVIAGPVLNSLADKDTADALAKIQQSKINEAAAIVVTKTLIPALSHFVEGLSKAAGFFQVIEIELEMFEDRAEKAIDDPKKLHYLMMKNEAKNIKSLCRMFYAVQPGVRTDFEAIPQEDTDKNYVDKWLEKTKADIEQKKSKVQKFIEDCLEGSKAKAK